MDKFETDIEPIGRRIQELRVSRGLTQEQLSREADVSYATLTKIESGAIKNPSMKAVAKLAHALSASLDDFVMVDKFRGPQAIIRVFEDVLSAMPDGEEMFISGIDERRYLELGQDALLNFIETLKKRNIRQKLISCEGDTFRLKGEHLEYRWIPKKFFNATPIYAYADRVATILWDSPTEAVILRNANLAEAYRRQFMFMWEHATAW